MCPVKGGLAPYDRKQPVYGLVAYVVDDESVRFSFFPLFLRILPRLWGVCKQGIRPLREQGVYIYVSSG